MPRYVLTGFQLTAGGVERGDLTLNTASGVTDLSYSYFNSNDATVFVEIGGNFSLNYEGMSLNPEDLIFGFATLKWGAGMATKFLAVEDDNMLFLAGVDGDSLPLFQRDNGHVFIEFGDLVTGGGNIKRGSFGPDRDIALNDLFNDGTTGAVKYGSQGADRLGGSGADDLLVGQRGDDVLKGRDGRDTLMLGRNDDKGYGGNGSDMISGYTGDDLLYGGTGNDVLLGGRHNDRLWGQNGNDKMQGGSGNDRIDGGGGNDRATGGGGADRFVFADGGDRDRINDFGTGNDRLLLNDNLWSGNLSEQQVVNRFADRSSGDITFDFGGGDVLVLRDYNQLGALADQIDIF